MVPMNLPAAYDEMSCTALQAKLEQGEAICLVDVRQSWEYARYHLPGALLLPTNEFAERFAAELDPAKEIVCICEHGIRSEAAAQFLAAHGYRHVATLTGGMSCYQGAVEAGEQKD